MKYVKIVVLIAVIAGTYAYVAQSALYYKDDAWAAVKKAVNTKEKNTKAEAAKAAAAKAKADEKAKAAAADNSAPKPPAPKGNACRDVNACDWVPNGTGDGPCTYSIYELVEPEPLAQGQTTCLPHIDPSKFKYADKPIGYENDPVIPPTTGGCAQDQDPKKPEGTKTYNVFIHTWTLTSTGEMVQGSANSKFLGVANIKKVDERYYHEGKACKAKKGLDAQVASQPLKDQASAGKTSGTMVR